MSDCKSEWVNIKFLVKLKKPVTETFQLLTEGYGEDCLSRARAFERHKRFSEGRGSEGWWSPRPSTHSCYRWQHWKSERCDSKRPKVGCSSSRWGSQLGHGKCLTNYEGRIGTEKGLCKNGSKTAVRWTKRMLKGIVFGPFATHWEWTRFVEFDNYLWWNLGIYIWSGNQATVNAVEVNIISKTKKKHTWVIQSSRTCWLFSLI